MAGMDIKQPIKCMAGALAPGFKGLPESPVSGLPHAEQGHDLPRLRSRHSYEDMACRTSSWVNLRKEPTVCVGLAQRSERSGQCPMSMESRSQGTSAEVRVSVSKSF